MLRGCGQWEVRLCREASNICYPSWAALAKSVFALSAAVSWWMYLASVALGVFGFVSSCVRDHKSRGIRFSSAGWGDAKNTGEFALSTENVSVKDALFTQWQLHVSPCEASQRSVSIRRSGDLSSLSWIRYKEYLYDFKLTSTDHKRSKESYGKSLLTFPLGSITSVHSQPCESLSLLQVPGVPPHSQFNCLPKIPPPMPSPTHSIDRILRRQVYSRSSHTY